MEKLAQVLKEKFLHFIEACKGLCRNTTTSQDREEYEEETRTESVENVSVQERAIKMKGVRGPKRPGKPKGPPAQTS